MQGEFRMITDLSAVAPKELLFNYDELKTFLKENLEQYRTAVVTEDGISAAKADRAKLNKLSENINSYRINVKKQLMKQYDDDFKPKCDELVAMTKEAADNIGNQIKAFEKREADEKIARLRQYYDACDAGANAGAHDYLSWKSLFNKRWENKGFSEDDAKGEIAAALLKTKEDVEAIRSMGGADTTYLLDFYKQVHDLGAVIRKANDLKAQREAEERREAELEAKKEEAKEKATVESAWKKEIECEFVPGEEPTQEVAFVVWATKRQLMSLKGFLRANGIKYGRVRDE